MSPAKRDAQTHAKVRQRRRRTAAERLQRDHAQVQRVAKVLEQALHDLGLPDDLVAEIEGRLQSQQPLLGKICGVMLPPLFGCRTNTELCRVRGWDKKWKGRVPMSSNCQTGGRSRATTCSSTAIGPGVTASKSPGCAMRGCGPQSDVWRRAPHYYC
jgi:hypothetical protein